MPIDIRYPRGTGEIASKMSWLWDKLYGGSGSGTGQGGDFFPPAGGGEGRGSGNGKDQSPQVPGEGKKWTGFDPTGLERAAKAARELDQSCELGCLHFTITTIHWHPYAVQYYMG